MVPPNGMEKQGRVLCGKEIQSPLEKHVSEMERRLMDGIGGKETWKG